MFCLKITCKLRLMMTYLRLFRTYRDGIVLRVSRVDLCPARRAISIGASLQVVSRFHGQRKNYRLTHILRECSRREKIAANYQLLSILILRMALRSVARAAEGDALICSARIGEEDLAVLTRENNS